MSLNSLNSLKTFRENSIVVKLCRFKERFYWSLLAKNKSFSPRTWSCLFTSILSVFYMVKPIEELYASNYWLYMSVKFSCCFLRIFSSISCIFQVYINVSIKQINIYILSCFLHILCFQITNEKKNISYKLCFEIFILNSSFDENWQKHSFYLFWKRHLRTSPVH